MAALNFQRAPALLISFIIFIAVAFSYVIMFLVKRNMGDMEDVKKIRYLNLINLFILLFGFYMAGFTLISVMLGKTPDGAVIGYLSTYYFTIVLLTFLLLHVNPYFINIFENTIGYLFLKIFRKENTFLNWFKFDLSMNGVDVKITDGPYASTNKEFLITVMDILKEDTWLIKNDDIKKCLYVKHYIGHFVWVYFACLICTFTTIKTMAYKNT